MNFITIWPLHVSPMKRFPWYIGIDLGTGSCKSVVVDHEARVLGFGAGAYSGITARERWHEQDPRDLLKATVSSVKDAVTKAGVSSEDCAGLSLGGSLHSLLALDRHGDPLTGVITWADQRAVDQALAIRDLPIGGDLYRETGCPAHTLYPLYKIMWLRDKSQDIFQQTWRFVSAKEYVFSRLTGEYLVDYSLASGSGLLNTHSLRWNPPSLELAGIREDQLSPLCSPFTIRRGLTTDLAREMDIPWNVSVVVGSSDAVNSTLGAGAVMPWQATCMVGTSGALRVMSPRPILDRKARTWCYAIDETHWLVGGAINNGGAALTWFRDCMNQALTHGLQKNPLTFEDVLALASQVKAGAGGMICLPFFAGERSPNWNPNARALFFGMTLHHDGRHLARALLEGIAFRFKNLYEVLTDMGIETRQIVASGGFVRSDFWLQVMTDALNRELTIPAWGETSALGAAFWAILAAANGNSLEKISDFVKSEKSIHPDPKNAAIYEKIYPLYIQLYKAVESAFDEAATLQRELENGGKA